jgi:hypothetical protein
MKVIIRGTDGGSDTILGDVETEAEAMELLHAAGHSHLRVMRDGNWWLCASEVPKLEALAADPDPFPTEPPPAKNPAARRSRK